MTLLVCVLEEKICSIQPAPACPDYCTGCFAILNSCSWWQWWLVAVVVLVCMASIISIAITPKGVAKYKRSQIDCSCTWTEDNP
eukprot:gene2147-5177_t